jgi:hypothetical protein
MAAAAFQRCGAVFALTAAVPGSKPLRISFVVIQV